VQYIRERTALPITRDYMAEAEARYRTRAAESTAKNSDTKTAITSDLPSKLGSQLRDRSIPA
jgi:hypothetical protein